MSVFYVKLYSLSLTVSSIFQGRVATCSIKEMNHAEQILATLKNPPKPVD